MKVSLTWLSNYVELPADTKAFCDQLDLTGTGVEAVETIGASFEHIVTAKVVSKTRHPDSDHMWVCLVDVGEFHTDENGNPEPLQIVCGAQNFNAGDHIVTALVGAELPGAIKIKRSKLRGVVSNGMNCSERELGLGNDHEGIMILPEDAPVGVPFSEYLKRSDTVLDLEITPNRPDQLSMVGMAREVGAIYQTPYTNPLDEMAGAMVLDDASTPIEDEVTITIEDPSRCPRYTARIIKGVKIGPSPDWMVERLAAIGQRSINNIVDVTNYILFLFGQPLHSFDLDKMRGPDGVARIIVKPASECEKFTTLDGEERKLTTDMTVIATADRGTVALAGVMGGLDSEVTEETTDILLEAATFEPGRTSRTSRNLGLFSEAAMRYERGVDDHGIDRRSAAAAALMVEVAGGTISHAASNDQGIVDVWPRKSEPANLTFRVPRFNNMMGANIPRSFVADILERLGCEVEDTAATDVLSVIPPTYRPDLEREIDLYEEVLRLWGMNKITPTLPAGRGRIGSRTARERRMAQVVDALRASGLNETMTYSFADPSDVERLGMPVEGLGDPVELLNPMGVDQSVMRQTIIPGLIKSVAHNQSRGVKNIQLFEVGTVFAAAEGRKRPKERTKIAGILAGAMEDPGWNQAPVAFDFFDGKGVLENLARELALPKLHFKALGANEAPHLQPGRAAQMLSGGSVIGWVGEIHPRAVRAFDASAPLVAFELDAAALMKAAEPARPFVDVSVYPSVDMDVAFVVPEEVTHERMVQCMTSAGGKLLESIRLFDIYRDEKRVGHGKKSMAYALVYRSPDRTLTGEEVDKVNQRLISKVCRATGAEVRG